jgi:hypothetical protein
MAIATDGFCDRLTLLLETQTRVRALCEMWKTEKDSEPEDLVLRVTTSLERLDQIIARDIERRYAAVEDYYCG